MLVVACGLGSAMGQAGTGTVTGHVVCGDTLRPARFATVVLIGVPVAKAEVPKPDKDASAAQIAATMRASMDGTRMVQTQTDVDGSFTANSVKPGDWYVFAAVPGYVQPTGLVQAAVAAGEDVHKSIAGVAQVHVTADHASQAEVSVPRGAAITGHALWDDGAPVTGARVAVEPASGKKDDKMPSEFAILGISSAMTNGLGMITNDLGAYRVSGLAPGEYVVHVTLTTKAGFAMQGGAMDMRSALTPATLTVFAPAAYHQKDAKSVTVRAGEERGDVDLLFTLNGLETVSGTVSSAEDHHRVNAGTVVLEDPQDKDFKRLASVDANGAYSLTYVPAGTYTVSVSGAADEAPSKKKPTGLIAFTTNDTLRSYEEGKKTVVVGDAPVTGQDFELKPDAKTKEQPDVNQLLKELTPP